LANFFFAFYLYYTLHIQPKPSKITLITDWKQIEDSLLLSRLTQTELTGVLSLLEKDRELQDLLGDAQVQ
jgi:hypothetical protein